MLNDAIDDDDHTGDIGPAADSAANHSAQPKLSEICAQNHEEFMRLQLFNNYQSEGGFEASFGYFKDRMTTVRKRSLSTIFTPLTALTSTCWANHMPMLKFSRTTWRNSRVRRSRATPIPCS
ncbi:hypothetical protein [Azospirillum argentinense]